MGTISFVGLYYEYECWKCDGKGNKVEGVFTPEHLVEEGRFSVGVAPIQCDHCNGKKKLWRRLHYTHARTYEEALKKLMPRLSQWGSLDMSAKWFLVWKDREGKIFSVIDVSKGVRYRWNKIIEKRTARLKKKEGVK